MHRINSDVLSNLEDFIDGTDYMGKSLFDTIVFELKHEKRGSGLRKRILDNPIEAKTHAKKILENPHEIYSGKDSYDSAWLEWGKTIFFKFHTRLGKKFEAAMSNKFSIRSSSPTSEYKRLKDYLTSSAFSSNKNLDEYELFEQVQLKINGGSDYFIADQIFVKYDEYGKMEDIIVIECKLSDTTKVSAKQSVSIKESYLNSNSFFEVRSKKVKSKFNREMMLEQTNTLSFNNEVTFIKAEDGDDASQLKSLKKLVYDQQQDKILEL
jgi:hypothetical protein